MTLEKCKELCKLATMCAKTNAHLREQAYNDRADLSPMECHVIVMASRTLQAVEKLIARRAAVIADEDGLIDVHHFSSQDEHTILVRDAKRRRCERELVETQLA
tara:strand:+ start:152 stop:463 length:312 start_codon:yes stop_codon:yes gene_type:complete